MLRVLQLIMGPGRWDAEGLARELECSTRTIHRILQTLSMAGVPWFFDEGKRAYRVRPSYRFKAVELSPDEAANAMSARGNRSEFLKAAQEVIRDGDRFLASLRQFCEFLDND